MDMNLSQYRLREVLEIPWIRHGCNKIRLSEANR